MNRIFPQRPRAFLFDMDGTLYDSMPNHALSWYEMVREQGIEATPEEFFLYEGATGSYTVNMLYRRAYGRDASPEEVERLYQRKAEIFRGRPAPDVMPGARELVEYVGSLPWHPVTVLVTGSAQGSLLQRLDEDFRALSLWRGASQPAMSVVANRFPSRFCAGLDLPDLLRRNVWL